MINRAPIRSVPVVACLCLSALVLSRAEETGESSPASFIRFEEDSSGARLQTAEITYENPQGITVTLVGAVHIADKAYFQALNARFQKFDAVLYEMVGGPIEQRLQHAAPGVPPDAASREKATEPIPAASAEEIAAQRLNWLPKLHSLLQSTLQLTGQLDGIDYFAPNFIHADMTHEQFAARQQQRNEGFLALWLRAIQVQAGNPSLGANQPGLLQILEILCRDDSPTELKRLIGRMFHQVESLIAGIESGEGTVILTERNKVALQVLQQQIALGKRNLAIFYGAAHLRDMEQRLNAMGFRRTRSVWHTAWDLPPEPVRQPTDSGVQDKR